MKRTVAAVIVAVVLALVGSVAVLLYARASDARALAGQQAVHVLVAAKRIPAGTTGKAIREGGFVEQVVMPASSVPKDAISAIDGDLDALAVTSEVGRRQLVLREAFGAPKELTGGLALPDGKVAVTVEVGGAADVAGHVEPGAKVAVFDTFTLADGDGRVPAGDGLASKREYVQATRLLLPSVEVLAVGARVVAEADGSSNDAATKRSAVTKVMITVAVTQAEAEKLVLAATTGSLYLALLNGSSTVRPGAGVDNHSLFD